MEHLNWSIYWTLISILLFVYYGMIIRRYFQLPGEPSNGISFRWGAAPAETPAPAAMTTIEREEWMDGLFHSLEETILHAQRKKYHPEEIIMALHKKVEEQKLLLTKKESL